MEKPIEKFNINVDVHISNEGWSGGGVRIHENVPTKPLTFMQMAEILEAFHVLIEKYRD